MAECEAAMKEMRIVLLGKTGDGKSSSANTTLGEDFFEVSNGPSAVTTHCSSKTKIINGRKIKLVDTPGFFDIHRSEEELKKEIIRCITECSPGPHAFVLVLKAERYTLQEREIVTKITETFGEDALKYTVVLFTRGGQLDKDQTIEQYVDKDDELKKLVQNCGGSCHVIDNKYWEPNQNSVQVEKLLNTIEEMVRQNGGDFYTNKMLQAVEDRIQAEMTEISLEEDSLQFEEVREQAINQVTNKLLVKCAGVTAGIILGAFLGVGVTGVLGVIAGVTVGQVVISQSTAAGLVKSVGSVKAGVTAAGTVAAISAIAGAVGGGIVGAQAAQDAQTPGEAVRKAIKANIANAKTVIDAANSLRDEIKDAFDTPNDVKQNYKKVRTDSDLSF